MSYINFSGKLALSDREHTWVDSDGDVCSTVELGACSIFFHSPEEARAVAARCLKAADDMGALAAKQATP